MTKVRLYALGTSTTLESNKSAYELHEVFHTVLRDAVGVTDEARVQSVLPVEEHVVPTNGAHVREQGGINPLLHGVPVAQHRINLADLPGNDRGEDEHQTTGPAHLLLPI